MTADAPIVVLAGGLGTRLREITRDRMPKPMVPVEIGGHSYPFLEFVLEAHRARGFSDFLICIGHLGQQVVNHFGDGSRFGIRIRYSDAGAADTGFRVQKALGDVADDPFLVVCGDVYLPLDARTFLERFTRHPEWAAQIATVPAEGAGTPANVVVGEDGLVLAHGDAVAEKNGTGIEAGTMAFRRAAFENAVAERDFSLTKDLFPGLIRDDALGAESADSVFFDIGTPAGFRRFREFAAAGKARPLSLVTSGGVR